MSLIIEVERMLLELIQGRTRFDQAWKECEDCQAPKPRETKKCGSCGSRDFIRLICSGSIRAAETIEQLNNSKVWPLASNRSLSAKGFKGSVESAFTTASQRLSCSGKESCPLSRMAKSVGDRLQQTMVKASKFDYSPARFKNVN